MALIGQGDHGGDHLVLPALKRQVGRHQRAEGCEGVMQCVGDERVRGDDPREIGERQALVWRGSEHSTWELRKLHPGDTIVVRASEGGCDLYGWNPEQKGSVRDIGDLCANRRAVEGGGKCRIRAHPLVLFPGNEQKEARQELTGILRRVANDEEDAIEDLAAIVKTRRIPATAPSATVPAVS